MHLLNFADIIGGAFGWCRLIYNWIVPNQFVPPARLQFFAPSKWILGGKKIWQLNALFAPLYLFALRFPHEQWYTHYHTYTYVCLRSLTERSPAIRTPRFSLFRSNQNNEKNGASQPSPELQFNVEADCAIRSEK